MVYPSALATLFLLIAILTSPAAASAGGGPATAPASDHAASQRVELARRAWDRRLSELKGGVVEQPNYPTEPALMFLSAWSLLRDDRYADQARRQLEYAHSRQKKGMIVAPDGKTTRDYQARQIYNFYLAYRILADGRYLRWADECARAMLAIVPRQAHEIISPDGSRHTHTVFSAGFIDPDQPGPGTLGYFIDVNQNAETGLAFGLLYHDPASAMFADERARDIAIEETLASMAVQDMTSGAIPIGEGEWLDKYDTAYGSYAAFAWVASQLLWRDERFEPHLRAAGRWLSAKMDLEHDSVRWWPEHREGARVPDWEAMFRLPLLWYCGIDASPLVDGLFERLDRAGGSAETGADGEAPWLWAHYDHMGIPRSFYLGNAVTGAENEARMDGGGSRLEATR